MFMYSRAYILLAKRGSPLDNNILMPVKRFFMFLSFVPLVCWTAGCTSSFNYAGLCNLRRLAQDQGQKGKYVRRQQALFERLRDDVEEKRLKEGISKKSILARYGAPSREHTAGGETCLVYHHPVDYFTAPVYSLCVDEKGALLRWEIMLPLTDQPRE